MFSTLKNLSLISSKKHQSIDASLNVIHIPRVPNKIPINGSKWQMTTSNNLLGNPLSLRRRMFFKLSILCIGNSVVNHF